MKIHMSKDWKPIEQVAVDEAIHAEKGSYLHNARFTYDFGGREEQAWNDGARAAFPNLSFLLDGFEMQTYDQIKGTDATEFYRNVEEQIDKLSSVVREQVREKKPISVDAVVADTTVKDWFLGKLDPGFYYNEENNKVFSEWIAERIENGH